MLSDLHMPCVVLFHFTCLCSFLQWDWILAIIKIIEILVFYDLWKIMPGLNMSHGKMSDFVSVPLFGFTSLIKLRNFDFESH